jgi:hypothetical protein
MFGVAFGLLLVAHVLVATVGVVQAARWLGGLAVGVVAAVLAAAHVMGLRRLARRRRERQLHRHGG